jgi:hypothetical protein
MSSGSEWQAAALNEIAPSRMMQDTNALAEWVRVSGTQGEKDAVQYLKVRLADAGADVEEHRFESLVGWPETASVEVLSLDGRSIDALGHALSSPTPSDGIEADLAYLGSALTADFKEATDKIAMVDGLATPAAVYRAKLAAVRGIIFIQAERVHEMCVSPIWGTPTAETARLLPLPPTVSVKKSDGELLRSGASAGPMRVRLTSNVFLGWREVPLLVGEIKASDDRQYVLLSAHHCAWHRGAMDNGTANAGVLEVVRLAAEHRSRLRRSLKVAFWPGHSQGRYSGSTWFFDTHWEDLYRRCALHLNVDSLGARGARFYKAESMPETTDFALSAIADAIGVEAQPIRIKRAGDQSFWSCGVPSAFMSLSLVGSEDAAPEPTAGPDDVAQPGLPWWWHTPEDTVDKVDEQVLVRDTRVYALATLRALTEPILPLRVGRAAADILETLIEYGKLAPASLHLDLAVGRAQALVEQTGQLDGEIAALRQSIGDDSDLGELNNRLVRVDRQLVMLNFSAGAPFDQDLALPQPPIPLLAEVRSLPSVAEGTDERRFLLTSLLRRRNQVLARLTDALEAATDARRLARAAATNGKP